MAGATFVKYSFYVKSFLSFHTVFGFMVEAFQ